MSFRQAGNDVSTDSIVAELLEDHLTTLTNSTNLIMINRNLLVVLLALVVFLSVRRIICCMMLLLEPDHQEAQVDVSPTKNT